MRFFEINKALAEHHCATTQLDTNMVEGAPYKMDKSPLPTICARNNSRQRELC